MLKPEKSAFVLLVITRTNKTRIESLWALYSDASDLRRRVMWTFKNCLNTSPQANLFIRWRKGDVGGLEKMWSGKSCIPTAIFLVFLYLLINNSLSGSLTSVPGRQWLRHHLDLADPWGTNVGLLVNHLESHRSCISVLTITAFQCINHLSLLTITNYSFNL